MDPLKNHTLTSGLKAMVAELATDLRQQITQPGAARQRAEALYRDERVGTDFDVWTDLLARRAAVLWILKSVYVRVLEDRGFLRPVRIRDRESQALFERLTSMADTSYLRWIFRDLASPGGLPELFSDLPAEVAYPSNALSSKLLNFWRQSDETTGELKFQFSDEHFDGRLMGDLYQDLDPVVKKRFALAQTPDFILDFILDETLAPAIAEFGVEFVRVLDPSCGSGHFLLAALKRLVGEMRKAFPDRPASEVVQDVLSRIVGIDINDYACGLARARLVMTALELSEQTKLEAGAVLHPQVYWADGLEQLEWADDLAAMPGEVYASLTRPAIRASLRPILRKGFHVVVGNPPYITEKDKSAKAYHKEKLSKRQRYVSASGKYSLGAPFTERMLQLCVSGGYMGEIVANSFMKRNFGKPLIREVLAQNDLFKVVDLAGARIPHHGTPTVILLARRRAPSKGQVLVAMGKKGDPQGKPGKVWASVLSGHRTVGYEDEYISVSMCERDTLSRHPWSIGGGGAADLKEELEKTGNPVRHLLSAAGFMVITGNDQVFSRPTGNWQRAGISEELRIPFAMGEDVRHWVASPRAEAFIPYRRQAPFGLLSEAELATSLRHLWPHRRILQNRPDFSGKRYFEIGRPWYEFHQFPQERLGNPLTVAYAEVATHNSFALSRGEVLIDKTAPVLQFTRGTPDATVLGALGALNSSLACFWMKQVCQNKGVRGEGGGITAESWEQFYQFGASKIHNFPLADGAAALAPYAALLDQLAAARALDSAAEIVESHATNGIVALVAAFRARRERDTMNLQRMVGVQEELDWLVYRIYGVDPDAPPHEVREANDTPPICPSLRPFELNLASEDAERRADIAAGEDPDEAPTKWFERHRWGSGTAEDVPPEARVTISARRARTEASRDLGLLEQPAFKRRWNRPDFEEEERTALHIWLADQIEAWARGRAAPFSLEEVVTGLQSDSRVLTVAEALVGRPDFDLGDVVRSGLQSETVPNQKHHRYKADGLVKRAAWEATWAAQHIADTLADSNSPASIPVPPEFAKTDFLRDEYWSNRGPMDVPKERFIALTEVPAEVSPSPLYLWSGLTPRQRARSFVELDERAERSGVSLADRTALLHAVWALVPQVAWESHAVAQEYRAAVTAVVGEAGVTEEMLIEWASRHSAPAKPRKYAAKKVRSLKGIQGMEDA